jgi:hypothetical protein
VSFVVRVMVAWCGASVEDEAMELEKSAGMVTLKS